jgi:hypothetical protein
MHATFINSTYDDAMIRSTALKCSRGVFTVLMSSVSDCFTPRVEVRKVDRDPSKKLIEEVLKRQRSAFSTNTGTRDRPQIETAIYLVSAEFQSISLSRYISSIDTSIITARAPSGKWSYHFNEA